MPSIGTSRGYGNEPDDQIENTSVTAEELHDDEHAEGHGHHAPPPDPNWVKPTASTFDDLYITAGDNIVDPAPVGRLWPSQVLDQLIAPPLRLRDRLGTDRHRWPLGDACFSRRSGTCSTSATRTHASTLDLSLAPLLIRHSDWTTRLIGLVIHFGVGILFAATYAYTLLVLRTQSSAGRGNAIWHRPLLRHDDFRPCRCSLLSSPSGRRTIRRSICPTCCLQQAGPANLGYARSLSPSLPICSMALLSVGSIGTSLWFARVTLFRWLPEVSASV